MIYILGNVLIHFKYFFTDAKPLGIYSQINYKYRKFVVYLLGKSNLNFIQLFC